LDDHATKDEPQLCLASRMTAPINSRTTKHVGLYVVILAVSTFTLSGCATTTGADTTLLPAVTSRSIPVQSGFNRDERFCGALGTIQYLVTKDYFKLRLHLAAAKADRQYEIVWRNNNVRGYTIGAFSTDAAGAVRQRSLKLFRAGEVRAIGLRIDYLVKYKTEGMQNFRPC
jgi:hypothetical protein